MPQEEIDYKAVSEKLQRDLEEARFTIIKLKYRPAINVNISAISSYIKENYLVCMFVIMALYYIGSFLVEWKRASKYV